MEFSKGDEGGSAHVIEDVVSSESHLKGPPPLMELRMIGTENYSYDKGLWLATGNLGKREEKCPSRLDEAKRSVVNR
jgi:hypothetical protein